MVWLLDALFPGLGWLRRGRLGRAALVAGVWLALAAVALAVATYEVRLAEAVATAREAPPWGEVRWWLRGAGELFARPGSAWPALAALALQVGAAWGAAGATRARPGERPAARAGA